MLQFRGSPAITSDAGFLAYRDLDDAMVLTDAGVDTLAVARTSKNGGHRLGRLLRQSVFERLARGISLSLEPAIARYRGVVKRRYFRGDAAFANPEVCEFLEAEGVGHAIRLPANRVLHDKIGYLLTRPGGRPSHEVPRSYASFSYQAQSWELEEGAPLVAKAEFHPRKLCPRVGFVITNLARPSERVVAFYNQRGTVEQ